MPALTTKPSQVGHGAHFPGLLVLVANQAAVAAGATQGLKHKLVASSFCRLHSATSLTYKDMHVQSTCNLCRVSHCALVCRIQTAACGGSCTQPSLPHEALTTGLLSLLPADNGASDLAGAMIAAMAASSIVWQSTDYGYSQTLLAAASDLYAYATEVKGLYASAVSLATCNHSAPACARSGHQGCTPPLPQPCFACSLFWASCDLLAAPMLALLTLRPDARPDLPPGPACR